MPLNFPFGAPHAEAREGAEELAVVGAVVALLRATAASYKHNHAYVDICTYV